MVWVVRSFLSIAVVCIGLAATGSAHAQKRGLSSEEAEDFADGALVVAESQYLETAFEAADATLLEALERCGEDRCGNALRLKLYMLRAAVLGNGMKRLEDAKAVFVQALKIDPDLQIDPDLRSEELKFALESAREELQGGKPDAPDEDAPGEDAPDEDAPEEDAPEAPAAEINRNWIRAMFIADITLLPATANVCAPDVQDAQGWVCARSDGTRYLGIPTAGVRNEIGTGIAPSTLRAAVGYDRILGDNFSIGVRAGFAFRGAKEAEASFLPLHLEARFGYWFRERPFLEVVRPHLFVNAGLAQVDTKKKTSVLEDQQACGAMTSSSPCTLTTDAARGSPEPRVQELRAYKQAGPGFAGGGVGVSFSPIPLLMLDVAVRASVTFPVVTPVFHPEAGVSFGF